jgi:hypothetical protein
MEEVGRPGGTALNAPEPLIANMVDAPPNHQPAYALKVAVQPDGSFSVLNLRNGNGKTYRAARTR